MGAGVGVALEGTVGHDSTLVMQEGHGWHVHGTVPLHITWSTETVAIDSPVVLVENWSLHLSPLNVRIGSRRVLWQDSRSNPPKEVGVVQQRLHVVLVVVKDYRRTSHKTSGNTLVDELTPDESTEEHSRVEVFDWQLAKHQNSEQAAQVGVCAVFGVVVLTPVNWTHNFLHFALGEPRSQNCQVSLGLRSPGLSWFLDNVL